LLVPSRQRRGGGRPLVEIAHHRNRVGKHRPHSKRNPSGIRNRAHTGMVGKCTHDACSFAISMEEEQGLLLHCGSSTVSRRSRGFKWKQAWPITPSRATWASPPKASCQVFAPIFGLTGGSRPRSACVFLDLHGAERRLWSPFGAKFSQLYSQVLQSLIENSVDREMASSRRGLEPLELNGPDHRLLPCQNLGNH
jgi:hypothetical protein